MIAITQHGLEYAFRFKVKASLTLEYVPAKALNSCNEKTATFFASLITSFANANGGTIFIGVKSSRGIPKTVEPLSDNSLFEWLRMILETEITPTITDCYAEKIVVSANGDFVIGIQVPNSHVAPHMCSDKRFYKRSDCKTVLMEEYEIRDLYIKGKRPQIELFGVTNTAGIPILSGGKFQTVNFYPRFMVKNTGGCVEQFYKVEISIPTALNNPNFNTMADNFSRFDDGNTIYSFQGKTALFQGEIATVVEPNIVVTQETFPIFEQGEIILRFFFSSGVQTKTFHCKELFLYRNKPILASEFVENCIEK